MMVKNMKEYGRMMKRLAYKINGTLEKIEHAVLDLNDPNINQPNA